MNVFEFVIIIVAVVTIGSIIRDRQRMKAGYAPRRRDRNGACTAPGADCPLCNGLNGEDADDLAARMKDIAKLEERVRVLERIVTDRGATLADEIDRL